MRYCAQLHVLMAYLFRPGTGAAISYGQYNLAAPHASQLNGLTHFQPHGPFAMITLDPCSRDPLSHLDVNMESARDPRPTGDSSQHINIPLYCLLSQKFQCTFYMNSQLVLKRIEPQLPTVVTSWSQLLDWLSLSSCFNFSMPHSCSLKSAAQINHLSSSPCLSFYFQGKIRLRLTALQRQAQHL